MITDHEIKLIVGLEMSHAAALRSSTTKRFEDFVSGLAAADQAIAKRWMQEKIDINKEFQAFCKEGGLAS